MCCLKVNSSSLNDLDIESSESSNLENETSSSSSHWAVARDSNPTVQDDRRRHGVDRTTGGGTGSMGKFRGQETVGMR